MTLSSPPARWHGVAVRSGHSRTRACSASLHRRVSAASDVAGYSRLMGEDEEGKLAALKAIRRELAEPKTADIAGIVEARRSEGCA